MRWAARTPATVALVVACAGLASCGGNDSLPRPKVPEHPQAQRYVSAEGSATSACSRERPCASPARALEVAKPGETVQIAAGDYPEQALERPGDTAGAPVTLRPAPGARVTVGGIRINASNVVLERLDVAGLHVENPAHDVTLRELTITGALFITSAARVSVLGGSIGPGTDVSPQIKAAQGSRTPPRDILIEGVAFHDFTRSSPEAHVECLHVMAAERLVLRGNSFENCEAFNVLFTVFGDAGSPRDILIENNTFSCCRSGFYSVFLGGGHGERWRDVLVRNNSATQAFSVATDAVASGAGVHFLSNIAPHVNPLLCGLPGVEWNHNVWSEGEPCGADDVVAPSGFRDAAGADLRLARGAAAIGRGDPASVPRADAAGKRRPIGRPDAGAYEY
jgi:hypothetical protein